MSSLAATIIFECTIIVSAALQIPLKKTAQNPKYHGLRAYLNPIVIAVYASFLAITFITTYLYQYVDLTLSTLLYKTEYLFIAFFSIVFLKEKFSKRKMLGFVIVVCGVVVYSLCS